MAKKSAKSPKVKPVKNRTSVKKRPPAKSAVKPGNGENSANELRSAAKASAARRLRK
jgi:hypothetical protein